MSQTPAIKSTFAMKHVDVIRSLGRSLPSPLSVRGRESTGVQYQIIKDGALIANDLLRGVNRAFLDERYAQIR
jgi:hypothetical protein